MTARERLITAYTKLVREGRITIEDVPNAYRSAVEEALEG